jgi:hypothetical protein
LLRMGEANERSDQIERARGYYRRAIAVDRAAADDKAAGEATRRLQALTPSAADRRPTSNL